jgi:hypothetical protein
MLGMCDLRVSLETFKMGERVARKLFATIRYRFSHLDNGLIGKTASGQLGSSRRRCKALKICWLITGSRLLRNPGVPVVVAD